MPESYLARNLTYHSDMKNSILLKYKLKTRLF